MIERAEGLLQRLKELGIATPQQIDQARQDQVRTQERFGAILVRLGVIRQADVGKRLAAQLGWLPKRLDVQAIEPAVAQRIPIDICRMHRVVPVQAGSDNVVVVATDDPLTVFAAEWLGQRCRAVLDVVLVRDREFDALLTKLVQPSNSVPVQASAPPAQPIRPAPVAPPPAVGSPAAADTSSPAMTVPARSPASKPTQPVGNPSPSVSASSVAASSTVIPPPAASAAGGSAPTAQALPAATGRGMAASLPAAPSDVSQGLSNLNAAQADDEPIVRLVDSILTEAVRMRSSDVHVESSADRMKVRYRIDGVLHDVNSPPKALQGPIISRIKIMANMNIAEKRLPQDGRLQVEADGRPMDVRVSILPALHGEAIVMRLLHRGQTVRGLSELGMAPADQERWNQLIRRPYGMVLVTGPTGSGKSTTLYATLSVLNSPDRKLITVEDPVEYRLPGVNQVHVRTNIGLTFASGLRAMLRQAPDVIMVGEIRDAETAQIAIQAALTGHLVFSTLHTNDAPSAVTRLADMGIAPFLVASTIQGVVAQRLVRRVCPSCQERRPATAEEQQFLGEPAVSEVAVGKGCDQCHGSGYYGRVGIYELLVLTDRLRHLVVSKSQASSLRDQAVKDGMRTLRDDGRLKVREGHTTMAEILRATPESE